MTEPASLTRPIQDLLAAGLAATGTPAQHQAAQITIAVTTGIPETMARACIPVGGIGAHTANHVLAHYGEGGHRAGTFTNMLIATIIAADPVNMTRLATVYPGYVGAARLARDTDGGITFLQSVARGVQ